MNKTEYMLTVLAEECGEIILEDLNENSKIEDFNQEMIDLVSIYEMLEERKILNIPYKIDLKTINSRRELSLAINRLQHLIFKSLRFGLNHNHPKTNVLNKTEIENQLDLIIYNFPNFVKLDQMIIEEKKAEKKAKVIRFFKLSKEQGRLR